MVTPSAHFSRSSKSPRSSLRTLYPSHWRLSRELLSPAGTGDVRGVMLHPVRGLPQAGPSLPLMFPRGIPRQHLTTLSLRPYQLARFRVFPSQSQVPSDLDGIADNLDPTPLANNAIADPDGENLPASLATGLSGRWDLEAITTTNGVRTSPNTVNSSIPAYLGGTIEADNQGMVSKAVRMSAMNQSIKTDPSIIAGKTSFTISLWFRFEKDYLQNKPGSYNTVLVAYNDVLDATPQFQLHAFKAIGTLGTQKLIFSHYDNDLLAPDLVGEIPLSALLDDGNWQHLTLTKSSGIIKIYRNSQPLVSGNSPAGAWDSTANGYLCFGALAPSPSVNDTNFRGSMDRIRTWSRAITQAEVTALHHQDIDRDGLWDVTESKTRYSDYQATVIYHPDPTSLTAPQPTQTGYARSPFLYNSGALDFDQDELNDLAEQSAATDLTKPDTDGDNLTDGFEIFNNFNPLNAYSLGASGPRDDLGDPDSDSLTTLTEYLNGSNPRNRNSDGDSKNDAAEIAQGSDPANAADSGAAPTDPPELVPFHLYGDYTAWEATLKGKGPHDTRTRRFRMSAPNVAADQTLPLLRGNAYELSLRYIRTKPGESVPWYCWETTIDGKSTSAFTLAKNWVVDNRSALLAPHTHSHGTNLVADKKVNLLPVEVETNYVDRDDPAKTWTTAGGSKVLPKGQAVYSGKETGDLVSWNLPTNITTLFGGGSYTWSAERKTPASPAVTVTGVTGVDKTEWKLTSPLDWKPGTYKIKCSITKDGTTIPLEFEQRVGVRTDDVVVVGWIDPQPIVLNTAGVQSGLLSILPTGGLSSGSGDNEKIKAALLVKHISEIGVGSSFQIDLGPIMNGTDFTAFTAADKTYALRWMFKFGSNSAPPADFANDSPPAIPGVTSIMDQSELATFVTKESLSNFKLINHYQVKYLTDADGKFDPPTVTYPPNKKQVWIGSTKDPSHLHTISGAIDWAILVGQRCPKLG